MFGLIDRKNQKTYTYMRVFFAALSDRLKQYHWLVAGCCAYPQTEEGKRLVEQEYCWLTGDELSQIFEKEDFQWIWGILCGFEKRITLQEVLEYPLPSAEDYNGYYQNPVSLQHPLASVEIVAVDSSYSMLISRDKALIEQYLKFCPEAENLEESNRR